ncbi:MAG: PqqD family protein [Gammaproteobacteria bacterium]
MAAQFRPRADLLTEKFDDALIVVDVRAGQVHELNLTAAWLWDRLDGRCNVGELAESLHHYYDVNLATARADINRLLEELFQLGLLLKEQA